jgi:hypothetical protein
MIREAFSSFEKKNIFGEEGISNSILIPLLVAVFPKSFQHPRECERFLVFFFFLKVEKLALDPSSASL